MRTIILTLTLLLVCGFSNAQFKENFAVYIGYAALNEPNISFEYRLNKRLAINLEGAGFIPFTKEKNWAGLFPSAFARINYYGGSIRPGISIYGKRRFGVMHRLMLDFTYVKSGLFREVYGVESVTTYNFYRQFIQYGLFYELTFRMSKSKRHHLFLRGGIGLRTVHTDRRVSNGWPSQSAEMEHVFKVTAAPIISVGYRIRLLPQRSYFVRE